MAGDQVEKIRVLLVDDHTVFRQGLRKLLQSEKEITIVGEASNGLEAVRVAEKLGPDVILMDIEMPEANGIEATSQIKQACPKIEVVALTAFADDEHLFKAIKAGVAGYISKHSPVGEITKAIKAAFRGESLISPSFSRRILSKFAKISEKKRVLQEGTLVDLTKRETEILKWLYKGKTNQEIAQKLFISEKTVRNHLYNLFKKLNCATRAEAVLKAIELGLVELD